MTLSAITPRHIYLTTLNQTIFPYAFPIENANELRVYRAGTLLTLDVHYTVSGVGNAGGGNVVLMSPSMAGLSVVIIRSTELTQLTDYLPANAFPAQGHEAALDKLTRIEQDQQEQLNRAVKLAISSTLGPIELPDPASLTLTAGGKKGLIWNDAGTNLSLLEIVTQSGLVGDVIPITTQAGLPVAGDTGRLRYVSDLNSLAIDQGGVWHYITTIDELVVPATTRAGLPAANLATGRARFLTDAPQAMAISDGTVWKEILINPLNLLAGVTSAGIGTATPAGQMKRITDKFKGVAVSDGSTWYGLNSPVYRPDAYTGADIGAKINACLADMPSTGGTIDARAFEGTMTWSTQVIVTKPVCLLLGHATFNVTVNSAILTSGTGRLHVQGHSINGTTFVTQLAVMDVIHHQADASLSVDHCSFIAGVTHTFGAAINLDPLNYANTHLFTQCTFDFLYRSIWIHNANGVLINHCGFTNCLYAGVEVNFIPLAPDSGQTYITNCIWDSADAASVAAGILVVDGGGIYVHNCTILKHAYGILVQCTQNENFNEFCFYHNRISHQRFYGIILQRLSGTGTLNGIQIFGNSFGGTSSEFAAGVGLQTISASYLNNAAILGNFFSMNSSGDMGIEVAGGNNVAIGNNQFVANHPAAIAISIGTLADVQILPNTYFGFTQNASVTPILGNVAYTPAITGGFLSVDPPSIGPGAVGFVDVTVSGLRVDHPDAVLLTPPADLESGLVYLSNMIPFNDVLRIFIYNTTGGAINGIQRVWKTVICNHVV